jgi:HK97 family phage major capsid protein
MKKKIEKMLETKRSQLAQLESSMVESETKEERSAIGETLKAIRAEISELEAVAEEMDEPAEEEKPKEERAKIMATLETREGTPEMTKEVKNVAEERATEFANTNSMTINTEERAVLVSSGQLATPTEVKGINDLLGAQISSIVDLVTITNANGMGAYKVAYQLTNAEAGATAEGAEYTEGQPTFGFVEITPVTETIISYISKQVKKQTPLQYTAKVQASALLALRKRAAKFITDKILASALTEAKEIDAIDAKTLRTIALSYGGNESVIGGAVLFLNKKDLLKFGDVRGTNEKKALYEITPDTANPNTGIIKEGGLSVKYCINSDITEGTLLYGQAPNFELALFSPYEIATSEDFKFSTGMLTIRGDVEFGGEVVVKNGFIKATVKA